MNKLFVFFVSGLIAMSGIASVTSDALGPQSGKCHSKSKLKLRRGGVA